MPVADRESGTVRVMEGRCKTCILRPAGERIEMDNEEVRDFITSALEQGHHVVCHRTLPGQCPDGVEGAVCAGFVDAYGMPPVMQAAVDRGIARVVTQTDAGY